MSVGQGPVGQIEAAPRRASSPPWPPIRHRSRRLRQTGTNRPHLCTRGSVALRAGFVALSESSNATGEGDVRTSSASVWTSMNRFGGADLLSHSGALGGLDARLGASSITPAVETSRTTVARRVDASP